MDKSSEVGGLREEKIMPKELSEMSLGRQKQS